MQLDIGGHNYNIKTMNNQTNEKNGNMLLGKHDVKECDIWLDESMSHTRTVETFMHEILHVILTFPPTFVNLMALDSKLSKICCSLY